MEAVRTYSAKTEKKWLKNAGISYMMPYIMVVIGWAFLLGSLFLFVGKLGDHGKLSGFNVNVLVILAKKKTKKSAR